MKSGENQNKKVLLRECKRHTVGGGDTPNLAKGGTLFWQGMPLGAVQGTPPQKINLGVETGVPPERTWDQRLCYPLLTDVDVGSNNLFLHDKQIDGSHLHPQKCGANFFEKSSFL